jgi:hypothetical protein
MFSVKGMPIIRSICLVIGGSPPIRNACQTASMQRVINHARPLVCYLTDNQEVAGGGLREFCGSQLRSLVLRRADGQRVPLGKLLNSLIASSQPDGS